MNRLMDTDLLEELLQHLPVGVLVLDGDNRITWANNAMHTLLGLEAGTLAGLDRSGKGVAHLPDLFAEPDTLIIPAQGGIPERWLAGVHMPLQHPGGDAVRVSYYTDITDHKQFQATLDALKEEVRQLALTDTVTGLPNYQSLLRGLEPMVSRSRRYNNPLSVVVMSVDDLDDFDARYGEGTAEKVCVQIGQLLRDQTRWADLIGRLNRTEFLFVLPETNKDDAIKLVSKLNLGLSDILIGGAGANGTPISVTFGYSEWQRGDDVGMMLRRAKEDYIKQVPDRPGAS